MIAKKIDPCKMVSRITKRKRVRRKGSLIVAFWPAPIPLNYLHAKKPSILMAIIMTSYFLMMMNFNFCFTQS